MEESTSSDDENGNSPDVETRESEPASYHALLKAAITQFAQKGFDGTRIETVAREANYNKALVYRHFGDKEGLFKAALRHKLDERIRLLPDAPLVLTDVMYSYFSETLKDREYIRLIIGEAMHHDSAALIDEKRRREYYGKHIKLVEQAQKEGRLPDSMEPDFLMLLITSMTLFPAVLPQIAKMLTGLSPESPEFQKRWRKAIVSLEAALRLSVTADQD